MWLRDENGSQGNRLPALLSFLSVCHLLTSPLLVTLTFNVRCRWKKSPLRYHNNNPSIRKILLIWLSDVQSSKYRALAKVNKKEQLKFPNEMKSSSHFPQANEWPHLPVKITTEPGREALCIICRQHISLFFVFFFLSGVLVQFMEWSHYSPCTNKFSVLGSGLFL